MNENNTQDFSVGYHIKESWELLKQNVLSIILINIGLIVVSLLALVLFAGGIFAYIWQNHELVGAFKNLVDGDGIENFKNIRNYISYIQILAVMAAAYGIIASLIGFVAQAAIVLLASDETKTSRLSALKRALHIAPLLLLTSLVAGLLTSGGFILFIIPGLVMALFTAFATYETIFNKRGPFAAISHSARLVGSNFGLVLGRILLLFIVSLVTPIFLQNVSNIESVKVLVSILSALINIFLGWFGIMYSVVLYKHIASNTPPDAKSHTLWMYIVSMVGWAILGLLLYFFIGFLGPLIKKEIASELGNKKMSNTQVVTFDNYAPSNCGLSVPIPDTVDSESKTSRQWIYEERFTTPDAFRNLAPQDITSQGVLIALLSFKSNDERIKQDQKTFKTAYPGINIYCTNNPNELTLSEFVDMAKTNTKYTFTIDKSKTRTFGKVQTIPVWLEGIDSQGNYFKEPLYLGVGNNRLFYIKLWGINSKDLLFKKLDKDIDNILDNLSYREANNNLR
ncbi:MAG: hypothetical protein NUV52_02540 [Candidatus Roizmanbacteria bacterium]|nr:hypothetical protein [Candidatus Roizmanbacteria bacterium]